MTCPRMLGEEAWRLSAWLDNELPEEEARELEAHVSGCDPCGELVASFRDVSAALGDALHAAPELAPDPGFIVRFRERRDEVSIAPWWTWRQLALRLAPLALGALLLAWLAVSTASTPGPDFQGLELEVLASPTSFDPESPLAQEPVLSIALGSFPEEVP